MSASANTQQQWRALVEGHLTEAQAQALLAEWAREPAQLQAAARYYGLHCLLKGQAPAADLGERIMQRLATATVAADRQLEAVVMDRVRALPPQARLSTVPAHRRARWLALAAGVALAFAGGLWFLLRPAALGLRLIEIQGAVAVTRAGNDVPVRPRLALEDGDQVTAGGTAALEYDGEQTRLELHAATATFRSEKGAKRLLLDAGLLRCTAAPQRQPFRLATPHASAEVVGTQFWLDASAAETTLAVHEGMVALRRQASRLEIKAGETAVANAAGLTTLAPADAWLRDLIARAKTGPPEALDFGACSTRDRRANWVCEQRTGGGWRFWNRESLTAVYFDRARHTRGVFLARVMLLPKEGVAPELAPPATATPVPFAGRDEQTSLDGGWRGVYLEFGKNERTTPEALPHGTQRAVALTRSRHRPGVWYRCVAYFDTTVAGSGLAVLGCWPADTPVLPAAEWPRESEIVTAAGPVSLGLLAHGGPAVIEDLRFAPLGPDFPPPPASLGRRTRPLSERGKP